MIYLFSIIKREFLAYFASPLAYIFMITFLVAAALVTFYLGNFFAAGQADLSRFFTFLPWLYLFFMPAISMRLWAEEWRSGTIELLLTLPIPLWAIVGGKYLAAWGFASISLLLTFPLWITVSYLGNPDHGALIAAYCGGILLAGGYVAISMCMSALVRSQITAFVLGVLLCFFFTLPGLPVLAELLHDIVPQTAFEILLGFSLLTHFNTISVGVIDARDIIFFASLILVFLWATIIIIDAKKTAGK